jgi:hypothetical protein
MATPSPGLEHKGNLPSESNVGSKFELVNLGISTVWSMKEDRSRVDVLVSAEELIVLWDLTGAVSWVRLRYKPQLVLVTLQLELRAIVDSRGNSDRVATATSLIFPYEQSQHSSR